MTAYSRGAAILGHNPRFREFLTQITGRPVPDAEAAAKEVRLTCDVMSRRELDSDLAAGRRYLDLVEKFNDWLRAHHA